MQSLRTGRCAHGAIAGLRIAAVAGFVLAVSTCSSDIDAMPETAPPTAAAPTDSSPAPTPTPTPVEDDEAELAALFLAYWDSVADLWNDPRLEPEVLADVATDARTEAVLTYVHSELIENSAHRRGEPEFGEITVTLDGESAVVEACLDQSEWKLIANGNEVPVDLSEVRPSVVTAIRIDDSWLIEDALGHEEASITC